MKAPRISAQKPSHRRNPAAKNLFTPRYRPKVVPRKRPEDEVEVDFEGEWDD